MDTCCIDKSSSAELTEAINSMFRWYKDAAVCYVYLSDLPSASGTELMDSHFSQCRWFHRGWTLQELVASEDVHFFVKSWKLRGDKSRLRSQLSRITGIDVKVLANSASLPTISVASRMSWAANRHTSRVEDFAYCLFGIFDVNLPLIYGEGEKAFIRLQEAVAQENDDLSQLGWCSETDDQEFRGVFAISPSDFRRCGNFRRVLDPAVRRTQFQMTNRGFHMNASLSAGTGELKDSLFSLNCVDNSIQQAGGNNGMIVIRLIRTAHGFVRHMSHQLVHVSTSDLRTSQEVAIYIPKRIDYLESRSIRAKLELRLSFRISNTSNLDCNVTKIPEHLWDMCTQSFLTDGYERFKGLVRVNLYASQEYTVWDWQPDPHQKSMFHRSSFFVVFGLGYSSISQSGSSGGSGGGSGHLMPWATIYSEHDDGLEEAMRPFNEEFSKSSQHHPIAAMNPASPQLSNRLSSTTLTFTPTWVKIFQDDLAIPEELLHEIEISVTTRSRTESSTGVHEMVLTVRKVHDGRT